MAAPSLKALVLSASILLLPVPAYALDEVIDQAAIAKLVQQLNEMKKQLDEMKKSNAFLNDQLEAIGRVGQITIPALNATKIGNRLRQDALCLAPDFEKLLPGVEFENANWMSICQAGDGYRQSMWLDPNKIKTSPWSTQSQKRREIEKRRHDIGVDVASKGMGQGDIAVKGAEDTNKSVEELESAMNAAKSENERLAVISQGLVVIARAEAQQTQLLAQLLKVQSTWFTLTALPPDSRLAAEDQPGVGQ